ncbi:uncharacterized protein LOC116727602 [Xiphophorus hellerii]|uniref:uncharacterized protein LOC116727602 n=1 Tax=Xiphophorus hellerii TaxID=8084 RepID=UPI0013B44EB4|nr:uncharacterized protein LOC116727602 [Xiphophorus hellerii]
MSTTSMATGILSTTTPVTGTLSTTVTPSITTEVGQTTTTVPPGVCASNPCLFGSTCEERDNQTYMCLCMAGEVYGPQGCQNDWWLILVIVSSILGCLLFALAISLLVVVKKFRKKIFKREEEDIWRPYQNPAFDKGPPSYSSINGFSGWVKEPANSLVNSAAPRIPRAKLSNNWVSRPSSQLTPSNSRQNLIPSGMHSKFSNIQDDMFPFSQSPPRNIPYEEVQARSSPYHQLRAKNPYDKAQGQTSPYLVIT